MAAFYFFLVTFYFLVVRDPASRFSDRVDDYARNRPGYSPAIVELLRRECGLTAQSVIADIGCGTGLLAKLFCEAGNRVYGIEPNAAMLQAARELLCELPNFIPVAGKAEATTLADASVDLITAAQAFHWFKQPQTKNEFQRILRPGGSVALIWNERLVEVTAFTREYEELLLKFGVDYAQVKALWPGSTLADFFAPKPMRTAAFSNAQWMDREQLVSRIISASYMPQREHVSYPAMLEAINELFARHQRDGRVCQAQEMRVYYGQLGRRTLPQATLQVQSATPPAATCRDKRGQNPSARIAGRHSARPESRPSKRRRCRGLQPRQQRVPR
jgi:ubiquinone/menaquinone biosynthesis C-methylase UbiE